MASEKSRGPKGSPYLTPVARLKDVLAKDEVRGGVVGPLGGPVKRGQYSLRLAAMSILARLLPWYPRQIGLVRGSQS